MKKIVITLLGLVVFLGMMGCSNEPPVYESGMTKQEYGEKFGKWLGEKFKSSNEADLEQYKETSVKLVKAFKKEAIQINSLEEAISLSDQLMKELLAMTNEKFDLSQGDWEFISDPYVKNGASKASQAQVQYILRAGIELINIGYLPTELTSVISSVFKDKANGDLYYQVLKESEYSKIIANDSWLEEYEAKKVIIDTATRIAKIDDLYFDIDISKIKDDKRELQSLETEYMKDFVTHFIKRAIKIYPNTIYEFEKEFNSKNISDFQISSTNNLERSQENLQRAIDNNYPKSNVDHANEKVDYELNIIKKINKEATLKHKEAKNKLDDILSKIGKLKNNENINKVRHNIKVFVKTYTELLQQGYEVRVVAEFLSKGRWFKLKEYDIQKNIVLDHSDTMAFSAYMENMLGLLKEKKVM